MGSLLEACKKKLFPDDLGINEPRSRNETNELNEKRVAPAWTPSPTDTGVGEIPWRLCLDVDPLHTGQLTGKVPPGWTREGWAIAQRNRLRGLKGHAEPRLVEEHGKAGLAMVRWSC